MGIKVKDIFQMFEAMKAFLSGEQWEKFYDEQLKVNPEIINSFKR